MDSKKVVLLLTTSKIGDRIERAFVTANFRVIRIDDPTRIIPIFREENPHVVVMEWDSSDGKIREITKTLRERFRKTGLIFLSKSKNAEERIQAIEEGADDCFAQPPEIEELVAKVKALVRRIDLVDHSPRKLKVKDIEINLDMHEVRKGKKLIDLTYTQFKLLYLLASRRDYVFTRDEILDRVWGENTYVTDRTVDVHVKRLREKLGEENQPSKYIQTIHGLGYRFA